MNPRSFRSHAGVALAISLTTAGCATTRYSPIDLHAVYPGDRVRVDTRDGTRESGVVAAIDTASIILSGADSTATALPLGAVTHMDRRVGSSSHEAEGIVIGAGIGFAVGLVIGAGVELNDALEPLRGNEPSGGNGEAYVLGGVVIGGLLGFMMGHAASGDAWQPVHSDRFQFRLEPTRDGARASVFSNY